MGCPNRHLTPLGCSISIKITSPLSYRYKTTVSSAREKVSIRLCAQKQTWRDLIGCKTHINNRG